MGRGSDELNAAAQGYVCVRVTDMRDVDLNLIRFDFDLTFAAIVMHADGTIYHRYGSRGPDAADGYLSLSSFARLLRDTLPEHRAYDRAPVAPAVRAPQVVIDLPVLQRKLTSGQRIDCVHCHTINDAEYVDQAVLHKTWRPEQRYVFPDPARIGLRLASESQAMVEEVMSGSPAERAGLQAGDDLLSLASQRSVLTQSDVQWALHQAPFDACELPVRFRRDGEELDASITLGPDWKRCPPDDYAWRPYKWNLSPAPGFGGPRLDADQLRQLGLAPGRFAFRVQYIVDWGERAHRGRAARAAGLQKGDVVLSFAGKHDFDSVEHWHAWVRLTRTAGEQVEVVVLRGGERVTLRYALPE